jgi:hypothetical protein
VDDGHDFWNLIFGQMFGLGRPAVALRHLGMSANNFWIYIRASRLNSCLVRWGVNPFCQ